MKDNYNAVWVVSKSKIHIYRNPTWLEIIHGESFTPLVKPIRIETETNFISKIMNMNSLSNNFLDKVSITDVKMHYIAESKEGQILKIYKI